MVRPREGNYKIISVNLDPNETDKFVERLKHNQSLSEVFRDFIKDENQRMDAEKNELASTECPILSSSLPYNNTNNKHKNFTLDVFSKPKELTQLINLIESKEELLTLQKNGYIIQTVAKTRRLRLK
jgi:hypothetical protein